MPEPSFRDLPTWLLAQAARRSHRLLHDRLAQAGATAYEYRLLSALHSGGEATQAELGRLAMLDRRDIAVTVRALVDAGAVIRRRSRDDARLQIVSLTAAGNQRSQRLDELVQGVQDEVFGVLTRSDRQRLVGYLARLSDEHPRQAGSSGTLERSGNRRKRRAASGGRAGGAIGGRNAQRPDYREALPELRPSAHVRFE